MRDYRSEFKDNCLTCKKYDIYDKGSITVRGYRCKRLQRQMALDEHCYQHDFDQTRGNNTLDDAVSYLLRRGYDPRPDCYVTTAICDIVGLPHDCAYITSFRRMRDEYMSSFEEGKKQIAAYDIYGAQIANRLLADFNNPETKESVERQAKEVLVPDYLDRVTGMIANGNFALAMYTYFEMIGMLSKRYGINYVLPTEAVEDTKTKEDNYTRKLVCEGA